MKRLLGILVLGYRIMWDKLEIQTRDFWDKTRNVEL